MNFNPNILNSWSNVERENHNQNQTTSGKLNRDDSTSESLKDTRNILQRIFNSVKAGNVDPGYYQSGFFNTSSIRPSEISSSEVSSDFNYKDDTEKADLKSDVSTCTLFLEEDEMSELYLIQN